MDRAVLWESLNRLDAGERVGKRYYETYGKNLHYTQYLYLSKHNFEDIPPEKLHSRAAVREEKELEQIFLEQLVDGRLSEDMFFPEGSSIEIEKTLRYVDIPPHSHDFVECICVLSGTLDHIVGGHEFQQGAGTFSYLPSHVVHGTNPREDCLCLTIKVRSSTILKSQLPNLPLFSSPISFTFGNDETIREILLNLFLQQEGHKTYSDLLMENLFQTLLIYLMQNYMDSLSYLTLNQPAQKELLAILNYMFENYQTVTLHGLAEQFHYSDSYLSNLFHKNIGETFTQVLRKYKIQRAEELLRTTTLKLEDICDSIGYRDTTQFIRNFKEQYGTTPGKYRRLLS